MSDGGSCVEVGVGVGVGNGLRGDVRCDLLVGGVRLEGYLKEEDVSGVCGAVVGIVTHNVSRHGGVLML